MSQAIKMTR